MTDLEQKLLDYLVDQQGYKDFDGEILPNGDRALNKLEKISGLSLQKLYEAAQLLKNKGLIRITNVQKGKIGSNSEKVDAVRIEFTEKGIDFVLENN